MEKILISACLVGEHTRYDGGSNELPYWQRLTAFFELVPFCPEMEGGLPCPRKAANRGKNEVRTIDGDNVSRQYNLGAEKALQLCRLLSINRVILKENSPSCGVHKIHDYRHPENLIDGQGVTAELLSSHGIKVLNEEEAMRLLQKLEEKKRVAAAKKEKALEQKKAKEEELAKRKEEEGKAKRYERRPSFFQGKGTGKRPSKKPYSLKKPYGDKPKKK